MFSDLASVLSESSPASFAGLLSHVDAELLEQVVAEAAQQAEVPAKGRDKRKTSKPVRRRRRKLPLDRVLLLTIGMAYFRDRSIEQVVHHLGLARGQGGISPGAIPKARQRLGATPVESLFDLTAEAWSKQDSERWQGLSVLVADGSCLNVADTPENEKEFGRPSNDRFAGGFPQIRMMAVLNARTHLLRKFVVGGCGEGELGLLRPLWKQIPDQSITLVDRGLLSWGAFHALTSQGTERHWMTRAKNNFACTVVRKLGRGDDLVRVPVHTTVRKLFPEAPTALEFRRVAVRRGKRSLAILTSAVDPQRFPAREVAELYRERWEVEIGFGELKSGLLNGASILRSKTPEAVRQEMYGAAIAYNLVRVELARVAAGLKLAPRRMSFTHGLMLIRNFMVTAWQTPVGALPRRLASLEADLRLLVLPPRRARSYKRWTRFRRHRYPLHKRPAHALPVRPGPPRLA